MKTYCVDKNPQENGDHAVHIQDGACPAMPNITDRETLGTHPSDAAALNNARLLFFKEANGCKWCMPDSHTP